jgi:hypothetical protein
MLVFYLSLSMLTRVNRLSVIVNKTDAIFICILNLNTEKTVLSRGIQIGKLKVYLSKQTAKSQVKTKARKA